MNDNQILSKIKQECSAVSSDNFERIKRDINDLSENDKASVIRVNNTGKYMFLKYAAAAAAMLLPMAGIIYLNSVKVPENNQNKVISPAVSRTVTETAAVTSVTYESTAEAKAVTSVVKETENEISSVTVPELFVTEVPVPDLSAETAITLYENDSGLNETENNDEMKTENISVSEKTESETKYESESVSYTSLESFESELKPVPGFSDKLYSLEFDSEKFTDEIVTFKSDNREYKILSPDAYTVYVYDVIIYGYDYFDFLNKGDYVLKDEYKYSIREVLNSDDKLLDIEELISSGLVILNG